VQLNPYLIFDGRCAEAFRFYEKAFNAKIGETMTFGNSPAACEGMPADVAAAMRDKVVHMNMQVGNALLMGSDCPPGMLTDKFGISWMVNTDPKVS
jgi:PhnB protein